MRLTAINGMVDLSVTKCIILEVARCLLLVRPLWYSALADIQHLYAANISNEANEKQPESVPETP